MNDLSRVKQNEKGYYVENIDKNGCIHRAYGQIREHCAVCNEPYFATNSNIRKGNGELCSCSCHARGKNNPAYGVRRLGRSNSNWRGGKRKSKKHIWIYKPNHPFCDKLGYVLEHRLAMEKHLGRYLKSTEVVHHKDRNPLNNKYSNLMLFKNDNEHKHFHKLIRRLKNEKKRTCGDSVRHHAEQ